MSVDKYAHYNYIKNAPPSKEELNTSYVSFDRDHITWFSVLFSKLYTFSNACSYYIFNDRLKTISLKYFVLWISSFSGHFYSTLSFGWLRRTGGFLHLFRVQPATLKTFLFHFVYDQYRWYSKGQFRYDQFRLLNSKNEHVWYQSWFSPTKNYQFWAKSKARHQLPAQL